MSRLADKNAIVTGAGGAIGSAIARSLSAEGAAVLCLDIDAEAATRTAEEIAVAGGRASARTCDVSREDEVRAAVDHAADALSGLDVLVNVAATRSAIGNVVDMPTAEWEREIATNLTGVFLMCKHVLPRMVAAGGGSVVNIASQLGSVVVPERPAYVTSKAAVIQLTRSIALDFAKDNIRCNTVSPGAIETGRLLVSHGTMERAREVLAPLHPIGRLGRPQEIANAVVFLASDEASFATGSDFVIDGGYLAV